MNKRGKCIIIGGNAKLRQLYLHFTAVIILYKQEMVMVKKAKYEFEKIENQRYRKTYLFQGVIALWDGQKSN